MLPMRTCEQKGLGYDWVKMVSGSTKDVVSRTCTWVNHVLQWTSVTIIIPSTICSKVHSIKDMFIIIMILLVNNLHVFLKVRSEDFTQVTNKKRATRHIILLKLTCFCRIGVTKQTCNNCFQVSQTLPSATGHTNKFLPQTHITGWDYFVCDTRTNKSRVLVVPQSLKAFTPRMIIITITIHNYRSDSIWIG